MTKATALFVLALTALGCAGNTTDDESVGLASCNLSGEWIVSYETGVAAGCTLPFSTTGVVVDAASGEAPVSLDDMNVNVTSSLSADGCRLDATWGWSGEMSGEPQGSTDVLVLEQTSANKAVGSITHSQWWWCGMHGTAEFKATATRK